MINMVKIISIEGNIGSGKTTFIDNLKTTFEQSDLSKNLYCFLEEPINVWKSVKDLSGTNILELFYSNPGKYSFSFQMMAFLSRLKRIKEAIDKGSELIFTERCMLTDKNIFAKMLYDKKKMNHVEFIIYNTWFEEYTRNFPLIEYIYLRTDPEIAFQRIQKRNRSEEKISFDYIQMCHKYHEEWFDTIHTKMIINANEDTNLDGKIMEKWINDSMNYSQTFTLTFDGASKGNPGPCGAGFVIYLCGKTIFEGNQFISKKNTNNFAEYSALLIALEKCIDLNIKNIIIRGDSKLVIKQLNKEFNINSDNLVPIYDKILDILSEFNSFKLEHIYRDKNQRADQLANLAIINNRK